MEVLNALRKAPSTLKLKLIWYLYVLELWFTLIDALSLVHLCICLVRCES
jgi:hypothetical protein